MYLPIKYDLWPKIHKNREVLLTTVVQVCKTGELHERIPIYL